MTPLEMLEMMRKNIAPFQLNGWRDGGVNNWSIVDRRRPDGFICGGKQIEEVIKEAFAEVAPSPLPIPKTVGDWTWDDKQKRWSSLSAAVVWRGAGGYMFTIGSRNERAAMMTDKEMDDFHLLRSINSKLGPPTEDGGPEKSEASS